MLKKKLYLQCKMEIIELILIVGGKIFSFLQNFSSNFFMCGIELYIYF